MYIGLKEEVLADYDGSYVYLYNSVTDSYRFLGRKAAVMIYLLKECRDMNTVILEFMYITGKSKKDFNHVLAELIGYIKVSTVEFKIGCNQVKKENVMNCAGIRHMLNRKYPKSIFIRLTNLCDKSCRYCFEKCRMDSKEKGYFNEIMIEKLFFENYCGGTEKIHFELTGGEPLLYHNLEYVIKEFQIRNTDLSMITKGTQDYMLFKSIMADNMKEICFSLDSYDEKYVNYITGNNSAFINILKCMEIARECAKEVNVNAVLTSANIDNLEGMVSFCIRKGVANLHFTAMWGENSNLKFLNLDYSTKKKLYEEIKNLKWKYKGIINIGITITDCENRKGCEYCDKALTDIKIDQDGEVLLCNGMVIGNLKENNLPEIWNSETAVAKRNLIMKQMAV